MAPPVQANLVNYLWPLLIVVLAPLLLPGLRLRGSMFWPALIGFAGAVMVIWGGRARLMPAPTGLQAAGFGVILAARRGLDLGHLLAADKRVALAARAFDTAAIGMFAWMSGLLALLCHAVMEPACS